MGSSSKYERDCAVKGTGIYVEDQALNNDFSANLDLTGSKLSEVAKGGAEAERNLSNIEAIKAYPTAIFWAVMVGMCVVMEGYDTILIKNFYAYPSFVKKYGTLTPTNGYQLSAPWQAGLGSSSGIGAFFGALANGYLVDKFGQKRVLLSSLVMLFCFIFITFFAPNIEVLLVGELLCGLPWGVFATAAPAYSSEVLPMALRVYLTSYTNMCFIIGQLIAAGVLDGCLNIASEWSYRIPFAVQWVWPVILFPILLFAPESPWHLVRKGHLLEAEQSLIRLQRKSAPIDPKQTLALIVHTNKLEEEISAGTTYWDCCKGRERRRTEIACMAFAGQVLCGAEFAYNASYFFQSVGIPTNTLYNLNVGGTALALFGTLVSWRFLMPYFGRRRIYLSGMAAMSIILFTIGILQTHPSKPIGLTQASLTMIWTFTYQLSVGQLGWAIPSEIGSTRLRQKTIVCARNAYYLVNVIAGVIEPYMLNPTERNLKGYTGFFWGTTALGMVGWAWFRLPESRGRSFEELDILFQEEVPARKFKTYEVNAFGEREDARLVV